MFVIAVFTLSIPLNVCVVSGAVAIVDTPLCIGGVGLSLFGSMDADIPSTHFHVS